jgi:hypothetical protein
MMAEVRVEETVGLIRLGSELPDVEDRRVKRLGAVSASKLTCQRCCKVSRLRSAY